MDSSPRRLEDVRFEPCPALLVAYEVVHDLWEEQGAAQLKRKHVEDLTHFIWFSGEPLPEVIRSPAGNLSFVCAGSYPEEPPDEQPVTLQVKYEPEQGYQLVVFLKGDCCPSNDERRALVEEDRLRFLHPRRTVKEFVESERCPPLLTDWMDQAAFRQAVIEAVETFILQA